MFVCIRYMTENESVYVCALVYVGECVCVCLFMWVSMYVYVFVYVGE